MSIAVRTREHLGLAILALSVLTACDKHTSVRGSVSDTSGHPVSGASVSLIAVKSGRTVEMTSEADGSFSVGITHGAFPGRFRIVISKPGYLAFTQEVQANTQQQIAVVLSSQQEHADPRN